MKRLACIVALLSLASLAVAETREYLLGDIDGIHYDGPGSVDDVYIDPNWTYDPGLESDFDYLSVDTGKLCSFVFPLADDEVVVAGSVTLGLRALNAAVTTDGLWLDPPEISEEHRDGYWSSFDDLGWLPVPFSGSHSRSVDISAFGGENRLGLLQDGQLNLSINDDCAIDYARLSIEVVPEPATLALLALGGFAVVRRRRK